VGPAAIAVLMKGTHMAGNKTGKHKPKAGSAAPTPAPSKSEPAKGADRAGSKIAKLVGLLRRPGGATIGTLVKATGWQEHSVRGAISGTVKKKLGLAVKSERRGDGERVYSIA
jgi:hypothetical protein